MQQAIQLEPKARSHASARQTTFSIALIFAFTILLAGAAVGTPFLGNYPDTLLPLSTDTTVTPDAAPTHTRRINVSTSTDFNGTLEGDPTTGIVRVTDAHPAGTYNVTVRAFDSVGGTATKTFTLTVTTPVTCLPVGFATAINYITGDYPHSVAVGDFNRDGKQDLAVGNYDSDTVAILLGDGAGNFSNYPRLFLAGDNAASIAVGDFNGDGRQDLAVANRDSDTVSILLGNGNGTFGFPTSFDTGFGAPDSVAVGDFNGDGKQDLAVVLNTAPGRVSILLGDGTGNFSGPTLFSAGNNTIAVALGDFNGDGKQDLAVTSIFPNGVSILLGDGAGNFSAPTTFRAGFAVSVAVGDFNGDGKQDLAVGDSASDAVAILLGDGMGSFSTPTKFTVGVDPESVAVGDFNGDGKQDLAVANLGSATVSILLGDGAGNFSTPANLTVGDQPGFVAVGDFNGDGMQDLAVANGASDNVSILVRDCPVSQITSAGTTCSQFSSGTAETLGSVQYEVSNDLIQRVVPRNFLYWVAVTASAGNNTFEITQTITTGNFNTFIAGNGNGSNVFDSNCVSLQRTIRQSGDMVTVRFNAPAPGTYYIAINFNSQNLIGEPAPSPITTVHYDFMTTGVPYSTSGLDLVEH